MTARRILFCLIVVVLASIVVLAWFPAQPGQANDAEAIMKSVKGGDIFEMTKILASPEMEGRLSGTEGYNRAARWAASRFKEWGLSPVYGKDFLQPFEMSYNEIHSARFSLITPAKSPAEEPTIQNMEMYKDFCPTLYSGFGEVESDIVFAGFGITATKLGWDDYEGIDVKGKIVAILEGTPQVEGKDFEPYSPRQTKLLNARHHDVSGLILINRAVISGNGVYVEGMPMVMVGDAVADMLFKPKGYSIQSLKALLRDGHRLSFPTGIRANIAVDGIHHAKAMTYNVVGMVKGSHPELREEYLIFGGHLDHLGPWPLLHPGASDNASGSAVVMELARAFAQLKKRPKRTVVFALFGAEELGLLGSRHMVANLPAFPSKPLLMVNHDMNGVGNTLHISGGKTYPELYNILTAVNERYKINKNLSAGEIQAKGGNSDYAPFLEKGIPAYSIWVRGGQSYGTHTEGDNISIITPKIMEDIVKLYYLAGYELANK